MPEHLPNQDKSAELNRLKAENKQLKSLLQKEENLNNAIRQFSDPLHLVQLMGLTGFWKFDIENEKIYLSEESKIILGLNEHNGPLDIDVIKEIVHTEDKAKLTNFFREIRVKNDFHSVLLRIIKDIKSGSKETRYFELHSSPVQGNEQFGIFKDVTHYNRNLKDLNKTRDRLEESDRLKTNFISNISHEIRTPMNAILGFAELLNIGHYNAAKVREYTKTIKAKANFLLTLMDDIIEISKFDTGQISLLKSECNLPNLLRDLFSDIQNKRTDYQKDNIALELKLEHDDNFIINIDTGRLQQVLYHLLNNALKFTEKGKIEFGYTIDDNKLLFFVKDTGVGLDKERQKLIFDLYRQQEETKYSQAGGSGIGLSISKRIIDLMGGKIWVESELLKGSQFYFNIPLEKPSENNQEVSFENQPKANANFVWKDKVILVAEDEEVNYKFIETVLQDTKAQILHATNGKQVIDLVKSINKIDLILMDVKMPIMNGYVATREVKRLNANIPVIAQTAFSMKEDKLKCLQAGCDDYISKPIDIELLLKKINRIFLDY